MKAPWRVLIADDHPLFREGLRHAIEADGGCRVVREVADGRAALEALRELRPDLGVLDISMPVLDGLAVVRAMRAQALVIPVILLTFHAEADFVNAALDLEVPGYVLKDSAAQDIRHAIGQVLAGRRYFSAGLSDILLDRRSSAQTLRERKPGLERLTPAERRILKLIAQDFTSKEIADHLGLSPRTVENHRTNICDKLDVHGVHGLVKFAYANKSRL